MSVPPRAAVDQATHTSEEPQWAFEDAHLEWSSLPADTKHERILCAAGRVFSTAGLDAPMPAVAAAAGAGVGSLYRQFPSKHALIAALVVRRLEQIAAATTEACAAPEGERWEALTSMLWRVVEEREADDFLGEALILVGDHPDVTVAREQAHRAFDRLLGAAKQEGKLRRDATPIDLRLLFAATRAAKQVEPEGWQRMLSLLIDGLAAPRPDDS